MLQVGTGSGSTSTSGIRSGRESPEVVNKDIDLSFVPTQFWDLPWPYHVMAAGDGLVCITDNLCFTCYKDIPLPSRFCLLNPLSRTCKTLPALPIPTELLYTHSFTVHFREDSITVFITGSTFRWLTNAGVWDWLVVTCDLTGPAATAEWRVARGRVVPDPNPGYGGNAEGQHTAWCNGKAFCYVDGQVLVHVVTQGPGVELSLLEAARLAAPPNVRDAMASLVECRGRIFFMALVELQSSSGPSYRIWELSADFTAWLLVTSLGWQEFDSLTEARYTHCSVERMINACGARHQGLLCSEFVFKSSTAQVIVGYNLETSLWEMVYDGCWYQGRSNILHAMELAPNSFLL